MRYPAIDMDMQLTRPFAGRRLRRPAMLKRMNWARIVGLLLVLGMWPAIIFAASRFF
jgi:hypothetical protein